ncbi:bacitracin ABC transporter permease [bacterium]|nr:MAG: bacitracin ABC transporter permease [bacterium]
MSIILAEFLKLKRAPIVPISFVAFGLAPVMGAVFMFIISDPELLAKSGAFAVKIESMRITANWSSYFMILTQAMGVGGVLIFGFIMSWLFGREYSDGTAKDMMALPTSRTQLIHAKLSVYTVWSFALSLFNILIALLLGSLLNLDSTSGFSVFDWAQIYFTTTFLVLLLGTPIAYFALKGKGYLAPLGFVVLTLVLAQIIAATGLGTYFPWAIPGIFSGTSSDYKALLNVFSYMILAGTSLLGYFLTVQYWKNADQF